MPMPREEDDDELFHDVEDVEFADEDAEEKKVAKKKTVKKTATKKVATKKTAKKKTAKKKVKRVSVSGDESTPKPAPRKRRKKAVTAEKPAEASFGAGLFEDSQDETTEAASEAPQEEKKAPARRKRSARKPARTEAPAPHEPTAPESSPATEADARTETSPPADSEKEKTDEYGRPEPVANYVVHIYEYGRLKRTIARDFTPELAEAYATEFCRTSKRYGRQAIAGKKDTQPTKELEGVQDLLDRKSAS